MGHDLRRAPCRPDRPARRGGPRRRAHARRRVVARPAHRPVHSSPPRVRCRRRVGGPRGRRPPALRRRLGPRSRGDRRHRAAGRPWPGRLCRRLRSGTGDRRTGERPAFRPRRRRAHGLRPPDAPARSCRRSHGIDRRSPDGSRPDREHGRRARARHSVRPPGGADAHQRSARRRRRRVCSSTPSPMPSPRLHRTSRRRCAGRCSATPTPTTASSPSPPRSTPSAASIRRARSQVVDVVDAVVALAGRRRGR